MHHSTAVAPALSMIDCVPLLQHLIPQSQLAPFCSYTLFNILSRIPACFHSISSSPLHQEPIPFSYLFPTCYLKSILTSNHTTTPASHSLILSTGQNLSILRAPYMAMRTVIAARELRKQAQHAQLQESLKRERELIRQRTELMTQRRQEKERADRLAEERLQWMQREGRKRADTGAGADGEGENGNGGDGQEKEKKSPEELAESLRKRRVEEIRRRMGQRPGPGLRSWR